jgi:RHS repeat-associated protein
VQETAGGTTTQYLVDDNNPTGYAQVVEEISGGAVQRTYTYGRALISQNQLNGGTWTPRFYGDDGLGSVRVLTDASGAKTDGYDYDVFGNLLASTGTTPNNYRFTGEQSDTSLGLYYLRARYYNTGAGRFWSRDSAEVDTNNPRELNRYVYVADNPVNAIDPTGNAAFPEYGEIRTTFLNVTRAAVVYGHRVGAAIAAVKGAFDALDARLISLEIRAQIALEQGFVGRAMRNLTVAQTTVIEDATGETKVIVAVNGANRSDPVTRAIMNVINSLKARGVDAFVAEGDIHAERAAYAQALRYTKDIVSIGISNTSGPCGPEKQDCAAFFDQLKITVFFLGKLLIKK